MGIAGSGLIATPGWLLSPVAGAAATGVSVTGLPAAVS
jgi:hypothetical protein